ncbi:twin-arginine translocation signal domain-containing protein [Peribacillus frigoritolerans]|nr:twin-arginine translocation signal domain-containing protein [Peribacillus frigoritolerans]
MKSSNSGLNRRNFLKVGGMSTLALTLGSTGVFLLRGLQKDLQRIPANQQADLVDMAH